MKKYQEILCFIRKNDIESYALHEKITRNLMLYMKNNMESYALHEIITRNLMLYTKK